MVWEESSKATGRQPICLSVAVIVSHLTFQAPVQLARLQKRWSSQIRMRLLTVRHTLEGAFGVVEEGIWSCRIWRVTLVVDHVDWRALYPESGSTATCDLLARFSRCHW